MKELCSNYQHFEHNKTSLYIHFPNDRSIFLAIFDAGFVVNKRRLG